MNITGKMYECKTNKYDLANEGMHYIAEEISNLCGDGHFIQFYDYLGRFFFIRMTSKEFKNYFKPIPHMDRKSWEAVDSALETKLKKEKSTKKDSYSPVQEVPEHLEDKVNHPKHYTWLKDMCGIEVIDITRHLNFCVGNAIKYLLRAGHKSELGYSEKEKTIEDLKKAVFYINDEIKTLEHELESK